ncbi:cysteine--tRNA ligase, partial [Patescibacteria group bacterium]|nr:cysteine--tRNA ligase [Patescibacteria group bacterium]
MFRVYNSLSKKIEEFKPINSEEVGIYTCGPTVYDYMHIGNIRTFLLSDIVIRALDFNNFKVKAVENITDIDDKIIKKAEETGTTIEQISAKYTRSFLKDIKELNTLSEVKLVKATDYIKKMIEFIQVLVRKNVAYVEEDGSVYFDISKFSSYGKLSNFENRELKTGTRILSDEYEKDNAQDFALWKATKENKVGFDSPWGRGRPGWHVECSAMSQDLLGESFDIHIGGIDLLFPHHENEIAQSETKTGKKFVNYWIHGAHILVDGKKMSKSLGNFYTLFDLEKKGFSPLALRYLYLQSHYRQETNFTLGSLKAAQNALNRLYREVSEWSDPSEVIEEFEEKFLDA